MPTSVLLLNYDQLVTVTNFHSCLQEVLRYVREKCNSETTLASMGYTIRTEKAIATLQRIHPQRMGFFRQIKKEYCNMQKDYCNMSTDGRCEFKLYHHFQNM